MACSAGQHLLEKQNPAISWTLHIDAADHRTFSVLGKALTRSWVTFTGCVTHAMHMHAGHKTPPAPSPSLNFSNISWLQKGSNNNFRGRAWNRAGLCACTPRRVSATTEKGSISCSAVPSSSSSVHSSSEPLSSCFRPCTTPEHSRNAALGATAQTRGLLKQSFVCIAPHCCLSVCPQAPCLSFWACKDKELLCLQSTGDNHGAPHLAPCMLQYQALDTLGPPEP